MRKRYNQHQDNLEFDAIFLEKQIDDFENEVDFEEAIRQEVSELLYVWEESAPKISTDTCLRCGKPMRFIPFYKKYGCKDRKCGFIINEGYKWNTFFQDARINLFKIWQIIKALIVNPKISCHDLAKKANVCYETAHRYKTQTLPLLINVENPTMDSIFSVILSHEIRLFQKKDFYPLAYLGFCIAKNKHVFRIKNKE
jgi:hypothetical protein